MSSKPANVLPLHAQSRSPIQQQPDLFLPLTGDFRVRDQQELMSAPFFSLSKRKRTRPIEYASGDAHVRISGDPEFGIATVYDADVLIWVATQLTEARDRGLPTSRFFRTAPYDILKRVHRGTSGKDYQELKAALERLQSTVVVTNIRPGARRRHHQFSWLTEWQEVTDDRGRSLGIEFIIPDWLYEGILDHKLILTIDEEYFRLTGGIERWLYRLIRRHAGRQANGFFCSFPALYSKSGSID